ncbi:uncharacterized protein LOC131530797 [Onychostoma macrolepis]|uniref:uncharacterized protein LOC131530797 n=1 Tax=Onychostoma macrolepis TaxID=369639 RepID=UPI00272D0A59|nr:uncharacterized protein LOC131530797 [Onychostoma macrolepis]
MLKKRFDTYIFFCLWSMSGVFGADEVKSVSVLEGDSVTLNPDLTHIQKGDLKWKFEQFFIAKINIENNERTYHNDSAGGRFRGRLELDQTGSLSITSTTTEHTGLYEVYSRKNNNIPLYKFSLTVYAHLPVPVIISDSPNSSSSSSSERSSVSKCSLLCSAVNVSHVTLSWYRGHSLLSSISASDLSISFSLPLEIKCVDDSYSCVLNNPISKQTNLLNSTELCQPCPEPLHCCGFTEAVIRLVLSTLVGVTALAVLVYDIRSRSLQQKSLKTSQSHTN